MLHRRSGPSAEGGPRSLRVTFAPRPWALRRVDEGLLLLPISTESVIPGRVCPAPDLAGSYAFGNMRVGDANHAVSADQLRQLSLR